MVLRFWRRLTLEEKALADRIEATLAEWRSDPEYIRRQREWEEREAVMKAVKVVKIGPTAWRIPAFKDPYWED